MGSHGEIVLGWKECIALQGNASMTIALVLWEQVSINHCRLTIQVIVKRTKATGWTKWCNRVETQVPEFFRRDDAMIWCSRSLEKSTERVMVQWWRRGFFSTRWRRSDAEVKMVLQRSGHAFVWKVTPTSSIVTKKFSGLEWALVTSIGTLHSTRYNWTLGEQVVRQLTSLFRKWLGLNT